MKNFIVLFVSLFGAYAIAQSASPIPAASVAATPTASFLSPTLMAAIASLVLCLNIALSAVQRIFAQLAKGEPGWLTSVSSVVAKIAQYLGSNPSV